MFTPKVIKELSESEKKDLEIYKKREIKLQEERSEANLSGLRKIRSTKEIKWTTET